MQAKNPQTPSSSISFRVLCSNSYNTAPDLEKITAKMLVIVFADGQINSAEFAALHREMPSVRNGRYVIVPVIKESDGEHNNLNGRNLALSVVGESRAFRNST